MDLSVAAEAENQPAEVELADGTNVRTSCRGSSVGKGDAGESNGASSNVRVSLRDATSATLTLIVPPAARDDDRTTSPPQQPFRACRRVPPLPLRAAPAPGALAPHARRVRC